jgi:adenylate cyclase
MSLIACSFISYFVKNDLKDIFLKDGIEEISTRIGIDFGDDTDVMWANFGIDHISELTTLSLHTSLAAKMQTNASRNGIVAGDFVKDRMPGNEGFFKIIDESDRYIFIDKGKDFRYTQWVFEWEGFLRKQPFIISNSDGSLAIRKTAGPTINVPQPAPKPDYSGLAALASSSRPYNKK